MFFKKGSSILYKIIWSQGHLVKGIYPEKLNFHQTHAI
jgi:hypothetical protein